MKYNYLKNQNLNNFYKNEDESNKNNYDYVEENNHIEIIQNIISLILLDNNKLIELKKYFGDDIGEKLLKGYISQEKLIKIIEILKNTNKNEKNLFRGARKKYKNYYRYNHPNDNILLKETLK